MWGKPIGVLVEAQVQDAARELCGQIIGYAAGEVSAYFPGILFDPPRLAPAPSAPSPAPSVDRALEPTRLGALSWEVADLTVSREALRPAQHAVTVRERIRALRDTDLQLLQAVQVLGVDETADDAFEQLIKAVGA